MTTKRSYYKEAQAALKIFKAAGYTTAKLNASTEVLQDALHEVIKLHPDLDSEIVFFYPEKALEILKSVNPESVKTFEAKPTTKRVRTGESAKKIRHALKKAFPNIKFLVKTERIPGCRHTNTIFIGWYDGQGITVGDVKAIAETYHNDLTYSAWFNDGSVLARA